MASRKTLMRCPECGQDVPLLAVTVRLYEKRTQTEYRYKMCETDLRGFKFLLHDRADATSSWLFDHAAGLDKGVRCPPKGQVG